MLPPICYTCGNILANIQLPYQKDMKELCEKYKVDHELLSSGLIDNDKFNKDKLAIVDKYIDPHRYCCRMRLTNFSDIVNIVR
jgi:DNA-directed RNA polymerase subunit N (RpoN/RPB10)